MKGLKYTNKFANEFFKFSFCSNINTFLYTLIQLKYIVRIYNYNEIIHGCQKDKLNI